MNYSIGVFYMPKLFPNNNLFFSAKKNDMKKEKNLLPIKTDRLILQLGHEDQMDLIFQY